MNLIPFPVTLPLDDKWLTKPAVASDERLSQVSAQPAQASVSASEITASLSEINDFFQNVQRQLQFVLDAESQEMVVQIKDDHGEIIRQIPAQEALTLAKKLDEVQGLLFEQKV